MKKYLITLISIILVLILMLSPIKAQAALNDISVTLSSETKKIEAGDEVTVTLTVTDSKKINGFEADLVENDILKIQSIKIQDTDKFYNWSTSNNKLEISGNLASETLKVDIILKVVSTPTSKVSFTVDNMQVNEDNTNWTEEAVNVGSKSIEFSSVNESSGGNDPGQGGNSGNNSPEDSGDNNQSGNQNSNESTIINGENKDRDTDPAIVIGGDSSSSGSSSGGSYSSSSSAATSGTATSSIPQTGENDVLIIGMIACSILAIATYIGYRKYKCI